MPGSSGARPTRRGPRLGAVAERAVDIVTAFVFPQACHVCGGRVDRLADGVACTDCWTDPRITPLFAGRAHCPRCGLPGTGRCTSCSPETLDAVRSVGEYDGALRASLLDLKRRSRTRGRVFESIAETYLLHEEALASDLVVPVPLHPNRLARRGHNQTLGLARAVARAADLDVCQPALVRVRHAPPRRAGADRDARARSIARAFHASRGLVAGRRILLVDDLYTTGATLDTCARELRRAGATEVRALTLARVVLGRN